MGRVMNPQGTSFIPKRPTQGSVKKPGVHKVYLLTYISFILFFGSILSAAGVVVFKTFETAKLDSQRQMLTQEREKFNQSDMESVRALHRRIQNATNLLDNHVTLLSLFEALEQSTLQSLTLDGFSYRRPGTAVPSVTIEGFTETFNSVMFQRTVLSANDIFADASFTEVELTSSEGDAKTQGKKKITFTITADVDPALVQFKPALGRQTTSNNTSDDSGSVIVNSINENEEVIGITEETTP